jgi:aspartokinase
MVTISNMTKKLLQEKPFIHEALEKDLINIMALAEMLQPEIEKELGKVKTSAISMAIRRYVEDNRKEHYTKIRLTSKSEILIKSDLFEMSLERTPTASKKMVKLYEIVDFNQGDTLNIIHGNYEILIVSNDKYRKEMQKLLKEEKIKLTQTKIASLSVKIPTKCHNTPGFYYTITKILAMDNISIIDIVNTESEATFILNDDDIAKAYNTLKRDLNIEYYER